MENISQMFKTLFEWRNYMVQIQVDKTITDLKKLCKLYPQYRQVMFEANTK